MISSFEATSRPPPKPSATSARPSSCSAPVSSAPTPSASAAAARSGRPAVRRTRQKRPTVAPMAAPTTGNSRCARTKFCGIGPAGCGIGRRVRKATAVLRSSSQSFMIENPKRISGSRRARQGNRMQFDSLDDIRTFCRDLPGGDAAAADAAALRQQALTKPPGSLGRLQELEVWLTRWQGREIPTLDRVTIAVFAGNHGVAARGVSAYPQAVTEQMVANFTSRGAAINQIAGQAGAELRVVPIELDRPTRDFTVAQAMDIDEFLRALEIGYRTVPPQCDLIAVGEMGIANTTTAATLCAALLGGGAARWAGRGTGVDDAGLARKRATIEAALDFHRATSGDPL